MFTGEQLKRAVCEFCHARCRVQVHSRDGILQGIDEDSTYPLFDKIFPPTKACVRIKNGKEWMYHKERVNFPLKRIGEKGEGKWQKLSWNDALDEISMKLSKIKSEYGAEALGVLAGGGRVREQFTARFCNAFGTPNYVGQATVCGTPLSATAIAMFGWPTRARWVMTVEKGAKGESLTKSILVVGLNPAQSAPRLWKSLRDAKADGIKLIVVDVRKTETAALADLWLQIRQGTDVALLMGMIHLIIKENLYDKEFVQKWCHGFNELCERVERFNPEETSSITRIPASQIINAARTFGGHKPGIVIHGMGLEHVQSSIEAIQARFILAAICGNMDVEGGEYIPGPARMITESDMDLYELLPEEQKKKQIGADRFRLISLPAYDLTQIYTKKVWGKRCWVSNAAQGHTPTFYRAILTGNPYPIKAAISIANNPLITQSNYKLVYRALKAIDLYVVCDYWMTPSAEIADYVLPTASWLERAFLWSVEAKDNVIVGGEKALPSEVAGQYDHRTDFEFFRGLGLRLNQEEHWPWQNLEEVYDYQLIPLGVTFKEFMEKGGYEFPKPEFRKYEKIGFATPTGKLELYSTVFEKLGYDPLPNFEESFESPVTHPELLKEYPFTLITGSRFRPYFQSEHRNIDAIRRIHPNPLVQIHPDTAKELGIEEGAWVWIETRRGKIMMKAKYFDGIEPKLIHAEHGWWYPELPGEEPWLHGAWISNANVLLEDHPDVCNKLSGGWPLKGGLCRISKVVDYRGV